MDTLKVDIFLMTNGKYFDAHLIPAIRERLLEADESSWGTILATPFKDPTTMLIVSLLAGTFGVDRFLIGDTGMGIGKLLTCGGFGIWTIIDWFLIMGHTRQKNAESLRRII